MYIRKVQLTKIRTIDDLSLYFKEGKEAGWHVILGSNGAGKSTVIRSIAATLIGPEQIAATLQVWSEWLSTDAPKGTIEIELVPDWGYDSLGKGQPPKSNVINKFELIRSDDGEVRLTTNRNQRKMSPLNYNWGNNGGWFSVAYGPFRRFTGGDNKWSKVFYAAPKAGAHLSVFGEDIALTESLDWLKELDRKRLKEQESGQTSSSAHLFEQLKLFINQSSLLPHDAQFIDIDINGEPVFVDGKGNEIKVTELSDGYRSVLSMTFELIRQLVRIYGIEKVFTGNEQLCFDTPGVVLIDEVDAHLHPSWQTKIGDWFLKYFPNIQFIVTTHSPLICRACHRGTIWQLTSPNTDEVHREIVGEEKEHLVYGDILEAYETDTFGKDIERGELSKKYRKEYIELYSKKRYGMLTDDEDLERLNHLKTIFHSDVTDS